MKLGSHGDTIIEVLLALTIVSTMLGGAYVLANRSLNGNRSSQERGEALKIAETQLERLKNATGSGDNTPFTTSNIFCLYNSNNALDNSNNVKDANNPAVGSMPALESDNFASYSASCRINNQSLPYYTSIEKTGSNNFTVRVRWDRLGSSGRNEVRLIYRTYK